MGGEGDPLGTVQEVSIWPYEQMVYIQSRIRPRKWDTQSSLGFCVTNWSFHLGQTTKPRDSQQKERESAE